MALADSAGTILGYPKLYVVWWGWFGSEGDPSGEAPAWRDYLENIGGSRWLETVTQYHGGAGVAAGNPNDLYGGDTYDGNVGDLPGPCSTNSQCASGLCNPLGNQGYGVCYPTRSDFQAEVARAESIFNPVDDGIIVIAMPKDVPLPDNFPSGSAYSMRHDSTPRSGHASITYIEAPYQGPNATWMLHHEIAETITDPRSREHKAYVDDCNCEIADKCHPPPYGNVPDTLLVGESPTQNHYVESLWSNDAYGGVGQCVMSSTYHQDYFFTACGGHLRHFTPWGDTATEDWGYPSGVLLNKDDLDVRGPGAVAYGKGRLDAFAVDQNGDVQHAYRPIGGSVQWEDWGHPGIVEHSPDAFSPRPGTFEVAVTASHGLNGVAVYHRYNQNGSLSNWLDWGSPSGVTIGSRPAVASYAYDAVDVFVTSGVGGDVYQGMIRNNSDPAALIQAWGSLGHPSGGAIGGCIDAASWGNRELEVFVQGSNGHIYRDQFDGTWSGWMDYYYPNSELFSTDFGVGSWAGGDSYFGVTGVGSSGQLYQWSVDNPFASGWVGMSTNYAACSGVDAAAW